MRSAAVPRLVDTVARSYVAAAAFGYAVDLFPQTLDHLTDGDNRPFGDDFINYWSGAALALAGRAGDVYNFSAFHAFEQSVVGAPIQQYHYSYPPVLLILSAPFALLPYVPALFVWLIASWFAFWRALRGAMPQGGALLLALATPAVLINAIGGQNGAWTAALFGGGLVLIERRPCLAGVLFGLLICKPQIGLLIPVALIAGRHWRVFLAAALTSAVLLLASVLLFGLDAWTHYLANVTVLRHVILENGAGVWHRMVSVFVAARRLGASVEMAYAAQTLTALFAAGAVALVWWRDTPAHLKYALLLLATCLATPYLQDYDLVFGAFVAAWLWQQSAVMDERYESALQLSCGLVLLLPLMAAPLGRATGLAFGPLFILPAFIVALRAALAARSSAAALRPASHRA
ncbi:MAG TPA: glycosyltransferase family 87 protein [Pseudolabrys sp.]|nr:glycosyltransferase family 87 protein [Pseudolabrys sp.]